MPDRLARYRRAGDPQPASNMGWPLYGPGLDALGAEGAPVRYDLPAVGPDELMVRHDAVGLCFSDLKEIQLGAQHPRLLGRELALDPVIVGHEASLTVVAVGAKWRNQYRPGQRFAVQPDVWFGGESTPYGYRLPGALQQFNLIGPPLLAGDAGCYLIPIPPALTYAAAALTEPWACVEASYRMAYRVSLKRGGIAWFVGGRKSRRGYRIAAIWDKAAPPARVILSEAPADLAEQVRDLARICGVEVIERHAGDVIARGQHCDDILTLDCEIEAANRAASALANGGIFAMAGAAPMDKLFELDLGRLHYDGIYYCGTTSLDLDRAYRGTPPRSELRTGGTTWIIGAGGPMGRMHVQRSLESHAGPRAVLATDTSEERIRELRSSFGGLAAERGVAFDAICPDADGAATQQIPAQLAERGAVDDVQVMAASASAALSALPHLARGAVVNLFAGLRRGTMIPLDAWLIYGPQQVRFVGHSGSGLADQVAIVERAAAGQLAPERSVVAVGGLRQAAAGMRAMADATYPGKIVIYPMIPDFPLTTLPGLRDLVPRAYEKLLEGRIWTRQAEDAFLSALLPE